MKPLLNSILLFGCFITTSAFAKPVVNLTVLQSFENSFGGAGQVKWTTINTLSKASFTLEGQEMCAFYDAEGELIALGKKMKMAELPFKLSKSIQVDYADFKSSDPFEVDTEDGISCFITVMNEKQKLILKSTDNKQWKIYKKL